MERILTAAFEQSSDPIVVVDVHGALHYANRAARALRDAGWAMENSLRGDSPRNVEIAFAGRWFRLKSDPLRDEAGALIGAVGVFHDITAARQEQEQLRRLVRAVEQSPAAVLITDRNGRIEYVNPKFTHVTGYTREEVLGRNPRILKSGHQDSAFYRNLWQTIQAGREWKGEFLNRRKDGEDFWEAASISPVLNSEGEVTHFVAVKEDITARKLMQETLREAHEVLREVIATSPLAVMTLDLEARVTSWNAAAERMFGWREPQVLGQPVPVALAGDGPVVEGVLERVRSGQALAGFETRLRRKDGSPIEATVWNSVLHSADQTPRALLAVVADVTERKRLEERLRQSQKLDAVGTLAGGIAHDFNNLLMIVSGYAELLADGFEPGDARQIAVGEIQRASERAASLINQLLAFGQRQIVQPRLVPLNALVRHMQPELRRVLGAGIELRLELNVPAGAVRVDPEQLEQVLASLAHNARQAMPGGGCFTLRTAKVRLTRRDPDLPPGAYVVLTATDTGSGMDDETRRRLFEPFFTTKGLGRGTGLGLSTVYGIVRQAGGDIRVRSEPNRGATFEIYLPRAAMRRLKPGGADALVRGRPPGRPKK